MGPRAPAAGRYRAASARLRPTFPCFLTHLGLEGVPARRAGRGAGLLLGLLGHGPGGAWTPSASSSSPPPSTSRRWRPPGEQILIVQKVLEMDYDAVDDWPRPQAGGRGVHLRPTWSGCCPGIGERIVVRDQRLGPHLLALHPRTARGDARLGDVARAAGRRPARTRRRRSRNLYCVGHWTRPGGGITPVIVSAQRVAQADPARRRRAGPLPLEPALPVGRRRMS